MTAQDAFDAWYQAGEEHDAAEANAAASGGGLSIGTTSQGSMLGRFLIVAVSITTVTLVLGTYGSSLVEARVERAGAEALAQRGLPTEGLVLRARWRTLEVAGSTDSALASLTPEQLELAFADVPIISDTRLNLSGSKAVGTTDQRVGVTGSTGEAVALQIEGDTVILSGSLASPAAVAEFRRAAQQSLQVEVIDVVGIEEGRALLDTADALAFSRLLTALEPGVEGGLALHSGALAVKLRHPDPAVVQRLEQLVAALLSEGVVVSAEVRVP